MPLSSGAQTLSNKIVQLLISPLISLVFALATLILIWGAFEFITNAADSKGREKGKQHLLWGIIGFFIMIAARGILSIVAGTFGVSLPQ